MLNGQRLMIGTQWRGIKSFDKEAGYAGTENTISSMGWTTVSSFDPNSAGRSKLMNRENTPTALALVPNPRPKALKKIFSELDITLWK
jgi:hypothetical protein